MDISDLLELVLMSALVFFILGYTSKNRLSKLIASIRLSFLKPRYLQFQGVFTSTKRKPNQ